MISNSLHSRGICDLLQNCPEDSSVTLIFISDNKHQCVRKCDRVSLFTHSPLLRNIFSDPFIGLVQDPVILLPDFSEHQAASLKKFISWDWSEANKWTQADVDLFKAIGINVTADRVIEVSEQKDELVELEDLSSNDQDDLVPVVNDEHDEIDVERKKRDLDIRCSASSGSNCKFTTRGSVQKVTKALKKHLGFSHFSTELGLAAMQTFDKDQCSFCGDLFLSNSKRMEHVLMKHDVLAESVDKLVMKMTAPPSRFRNKPVLIEDGEEVMEMPVKNDTVDVEDQKLSCKRNRKSKRTNRNPQDIVMVEDKTEVAQEPTKSEYQASSDSRRSLKRSRLESVSEEKDWVFSPSVKRCRVMLRCLKEEDKTGKNIFIVSNEESEETVDESVKNSKTVDLERSEVSNQEQHKCKSETIENLNTSSVAKKNRTEFHNFEKNRLNEFIDSLLSDAPASGSSESNLEEVLITEPTEPSTIYPEIEEISRNEMTYDDKLVELRIPEPEVATPTRTNADALKTIPLTPMNPPLIVENPMFEDEETPIKEQKANIPQNSTEKTKFVRLEMKMSPSDTRTVVGRTENQIIITDSRAKEKPGSSPITFNGKPTRSVTDKIILQKTNKVKLSAFNTKSGKNVKPEKVEEKDEIIIDEIVNSPQPVESELGLESMTDIDHEIQRSLILDQDLSDDEEDDCDNNELVSRFTDARESLMIELGVIEDDIVVC